MVADSPSIHLRGAAPTKSRPFWKRKGFWEFLEYPLGVMVAICAAWVANASTKEKLKPSLLVLIFSITVFVVKATGWWVSYKAKSGDTEQAKRIIKRLVDLFSMRYFEAETNELDKAKHRVTLYDCEEYKSRKGRKKRLRIFCRAGRYPESTTTWAIDDNDPNACRGIAAQIWFHKTVIFKEAEQEWSDSGTKASKKKYAESFGLTLEEVESLTLKSVAVGGAPIIVHNRKWGVLLLDSLKKGIVADHPEQRELLVRYAAVIGTVIEGIDP